MSDVFANVAGAIVGLLLVIVLRQREKIEELKAENELMEHSNRLSESLSRSQILLLQGQIDRLLKMKAVRNPNIPQNIIEAVKYAMKKAHPDNGGNAEDFMKFKKCYEQLTRK